MLSEAGRGVQHISLLRDLCSHEIRMLTVFLFKTCLSYWLCLHLDKHKDERSKEYSGKAKAPFHLSYQDLSNWKHFRIWYPEKFLQLTVNFSWNLIQAGSYFCEYENKHFLKWAFWMSNTLSEGDCSALFYPQEGPCSITGSQGISFTQVFGSKSSLGKWREGAT